MELTQGILTGLEQALNGLLKLDEEKHQELTGLKNKRIAIELKDWYLTLLFSIDSKGGVHISSGDKDEADAWISATPFDFAETLMTEHKEDGLFNGTVEFGGDTKTAQSFSQIMSSLDPDWEELLSRYTGDILAHQLGNQLRKTLKWAKRNASVMRMNLGEYLTEETQLLPTAYEIRYWQEQVDRLRDDLARLEARIHLLLNP